MAGKVTFGILGLLAFIGSGNLKLDLGNKGEDMLKSPIARKLVVFAIAFLYTKDILVSVIVTVLYTFVVSVLLYEQDYQTAELVEDNNRILHELQGVSFNHPKQGYHTFM